MKKMMVFILILFLPVTTMAVEFPDELSPEEIVDAAYYTMISDEGEILLKTGRRMVVDDEFLTGDNRLFRVYSVEGKTARARLIQKIHMEKHLEENFRQEARAVLAAANGEEEGPKRLIGIYHTHNAESYVPSDGTHSINGRGGIHQVGTAFKEALEAEGVRVIHDETLHLPHDRGAYRRSRVTAQRLLAKGPDVIFDVHRDAAPAEAYAAQVDDMWITQVLFVVGRQNHNFSINRSFAFDLKGYADQLQPEVVKGVLFGQGNYNQDLTPLKLLLEVGSHLNTREAAEAGIREFAATVDFYFYGPDEGEPSPSVPGAGAPSETRLGFWSAARTILGILAFLLLAGLGFLWINAGSSEEFLRIVSSYRGKLEERWRQVLAAIRENWTYERDAAYLRKKWQWVRDRFREILRQPLK